MTAPVESWMTPIKLPVSYCAKAAREGSINRNAIARRNDPKPRIPRLFAQVVPACWHTDRFVEFILPPHVSVSSAVYCLPFWPGLSLFRKYLDWRIRLLI